MRRPATAIGSPAVISRRGHGKVAFLDLKDGTGQIQVQARVDELGEATRGCFRWTSATSSASRARLLIRRGELSVRADAWELLSKKPAAAAGEVPRPGGRRDPLPPARARPDGERGDPRSLPESGPTIAEVRRWFDSRGFVEVETPGAPAPLRRGARPSLHHPPQRARPRPLSADRDRALPEAARGRRDRKVYELGKDFRNEGISHKHNPEFTMLEWYEAYADYNDTAMSSRGSSPRSRRRSSAPRRSSGRERRSTCHRPGAESRSAMRSRSRLASTCWSIRRASNSPGDGQRARSEEGWGKLVDGLLSKKVEPNLIQPTFVLDYPVELSPFAKRHRSERGTGGALGGVCGRHRDLNAFTELNDPDEQRRRFESQAEENRPGDEETQPYDETFVESLEQGMPPTGGAGLGIDRLVMILTGAKTLREVRPLPGDAGLAAGRLRLASASGTRPNPAERAARLLLRPGTHLAPQSFARGIGGLHGGERESHPRSSRRGCDAGRPRACRDGQRDPPHHICRA